MERPNIRRRDGFRPAAAAKLVRVAYRMLGSVADAEDVVQEAYHALARRPTAARSVSPEAFLRQVVTRLCLDVLKSARNASARPTSAPGCPSRLSRRGGGEGRADDVTLPLMLALERLSPLERAAFLLHDVFGLRFEEVADDPGGATLQPAVSWPAGRAPVSRPPALASHGPRTAARRSPRPSSPPAQRRHGPR